MRRTRFAKAFGRSLFLTASCLIAGIWGSCSKTGDVIAPDTDQAAFQLSVKNVGDSRPQTRTIISGDKLDKVLWSEKDIISFHYLRQDQRENLLQSDLRVWRIYPDETIFTGDLTAEEGYGYDCYAVYPKPASESYNYVADASDPAVPYAVFNLPSTQNGLYDSSIDGTSCDIMVADPLKGAVLADAAQKKEMNFTHKCHAFRIQVPTDRNLWGVDIHGLRVVFPTEVVGTLTVNMADPAAAPVLTNGESTVWLDLTKALNESTKDDPDGIYVWLFTAPFTMSGEIRFTAYNEDGRQSENISVNLSEPRTFEAGTITPITLTIPAELQPSYVTLKITRNNIGEPYKTVTVTAPEGALFWNGSRSMVFEKNDTWEYQIGFYESFDDVPNNLEILKSADLQVTYESEHAIFHDSISLADFQSGSTDKVFTREIPYILYQDFSSASEHDGGNETSTLDSYNLSGWTASNFGLHAGRCAEIRRYLGAPPNTDPKPGRLDSPFLTALKPGMSVNLTATYNIGGTRNDKLYAQYAFGTDTRSGALDRDTEIENILVSYKDAGTDGSSTNLPLSETVDFQASSATRLSWRTGSRYSGFFMAKTVYVYIDNIIVQVKSDNPEPLPTAQ